MRSLTRLTLIGVRAALDAGVCHFCDGSFQQDCRGSATVRTWSSSSRPVGIMSMRRALPCTGGRVIAVFPLRCSSSQRVTWIFAPRSHHVVISTLSPDPRTRSIRNPSAWFWTLPSVCAVENYYHIKTLQWSLPQRSKRESVGEPRRPAGALNLKQRLPVLTRR